jgi:predicted RNA binding protein YcfA (HicA-like mRNA interferase family)
MDRRRRLLERLRSGHLQNVSFWDFCDLLEAFGFELDRTKGSHFSYHHRALPRPFPVQPRKNQAKPEQLRQFLRYLDGYDLTMENRR